MTWKLRSFGGLPIQLSQIQLTSGGITVGSKRLERLFHWDELLGHMTSTKGVQVMCCESSILLIVMYSGSLHLPQLRPAFSRWLCITPLSAYPMTLTLFASSMDLTTVYLHVNLPFCGIHTYWTVIYFCPNNGKHTRIMYAYLSKVSSHDRISIKQFMVSKLLYLLFSMLPSPSFCSWFFCIEGSKECIHKCSLFQGKKNQPHS